MTGFRKSVTKDVQLLIATPGTANVTLEVGAQSETVEVPARPRSLTRPMPPSETRSAKTRSKDCPLEGRNVPDLLTLQAGVTYTGNRSDVDRDVDTRSGAVNGARSDQSNITLDGVDVNDQVNGSAFTSVLPVTLDSCRNFASPRRTRTQIRAVPRERKYPSLQRAVPIIFTVLYMSITAIPQPVRMTIS